MLVWGSFVNQFFSSDQTKQNINKINKTSLKLVCEGLAKVGLGGLSDLKQTLRWVLKN